MGNRFDVNIAGYALTVRTERSADHMARLAETLNGRVREIQKAGGTANYLNVVMLAAMELADDVLTSEAKIGEATERIAEVEERVRKLQDETRGLRDRNRELANQVGKLGEEIEALRVERTALKEKVEQRSRNLLATLEDALR